MQGVSEESSGWSTFTMTALLLADSSSSSGYDDKPTSWIFPEEFDYGDDASVFQVPGFKTLSSDEVLSLDNQNNTSNWS